MQLCRDFELHCLDILLHKLFYMLYFRSYSEISVCPDIPDYERKYTKKKVCVKECQYKSIKNHNPVAYGGGRSSALELCNLVATIQGRAT